MLCHLIPKVRPTDPKVDSIGCPGPRYLNTVGEGWGFIASSSAVVFMDNHDSQRGEAKLTYKSGALYYLANATGRAFHIFSLDLGDLLEMPLLEVFMLAHPYGYPMAGPVVILWAVFLAKPLLYLCVTVYI